MKSMMAISIILLAFYSCKKDNNSLPQYDLKKAILGKWEYHGQTVFKHNGDQSGGGILGTYPIYNFLDNDSCIADKHDTSTFKINYNTQINFSGDRIINRGLFNVEIKDTDMIWRQVPPFPIAQPPSTTIDSILVYFKRKI